MYVSRLASETIPGWLPETRPGRRVVGYFLGEGIGAEIIPPSVELLSTVCGRLNVNLELRCGSLIGKPAILATGKALTDQAAGLCAEIFSEGGAILCGPGGGRFVYELRAHFDLYCKFTPIRPCPGLRDAGCIKPHHLRNVDILAVRENTGGLYFGQSSLTKNESGDAMVSHHYGYTATQVRRLLKSAFAAALLRRGKICLTVKPDGIPAVSQFWRHYAEEFSAETGVELAVLEIDNAVYQLIASPQTFDVVVSPNMLGDIIADAGALLQGSRGMSYSGNFGAGGKAVYQTAHGAGYDIAGKDLANPLGQFFSAAMLLQESFGLSEGAALIFKAISSVLSRGFRTADIANSESVVVGTKEMSRLVLNAVSEEV